MSSLLIAPLAAVLVIALAWVALAAQRWWQRRLVGRLLIGTPTPARRDELPDILYFTGVDCTVCHVAQRPALLRLRGLIDDVAIREIDVAQEPTWTQRYRVMTLPTTVVLDAGGRTVAVNAGFTPQAVLRDQVETARRSSLDAFA